MRGFQIETISGPVKINRQEVDRIEAIFLAVGLALDQKHLFSEAIGCIRFFRIAIPKIGFFKGYRGVLWVGADRADPDKFLNAFLPSSLHELDSHHGIVVEKTARSGTIQPDPADVSCKVYYQIPSLDGLHANLPLPEVLFAAFRDQDILSRNPSTDHFFY